MKHIELISPEKAYMTALRKRKNELTYARKEAEKRLSTSPEGTLRIRQGKCFTVLDGKSLHYIPQKNIALIKALAQKAYDLVLLKRIGVELKLVDKLIALNEFHPVKSLYSHLKPARQKYITPATLDDDAYVESWKSVRFAHKPFMKGDPVLKTPAGIRMRSKSELLIAYLLDEAGIAYRYEYPLEIEINGQKLLFHPDFYCLDPVTRSEFVWEHFGLMDDQTYRYHTEEKLMDYLFSGFFNEKKLLTTYEEKEHPINPEEMRKDLAFFLDNLRK